MSDYTKDIVEVADRVKAILEANIETLGVKTVYYGRTDKIPDYPSLSVEGGSKTRSLVGEGLSRKWDIRLSCEIYIYFGTVAAASENARENEILTERVEDILHEHLTLDGSVIFGFVSRVDPGITVRGETMVKVSRLTWEARSRQTF